MTPEDRLELAPEAALPEERGGGFWKKLRRGLAMTHTELLERIDAAVRDRPVLDQETLEFLEETLIGADLGVETSLELVEAVRDTATSGEALDGVRLRQILVDQMAILLLDAPPPVRDAGRPLVTLLVGVNGVGKTTSAAKLAHRSKGRGD